MNLLGNKNILIILILSLIYFINTATALENRILIKIDDKIITSQDVDNEINYLKALNPTLKKLSKEEIFTIGKNSLIREKIKNLELLRFMKKIQISDDQFNRLLKARYLKSNFSSIEDFENHLNDYKIGINIIKKKLTIETLWNELIYAKFSTKVKINKIKLKEEAKKIANEQRKIYFLSEIIFRISENNDLEKKTRLIKDSILNNGFENTALFYSIADSSGLGGKLGWIKESALSKKVVKKLSNLKIGDFTDPIFTPSGYLIVKIEDMKNENKKNSTEDILQNLIKFKTNQQLNQYSNNYFKKIKKKFKINEL